MRLHDVQSTMIRFLNIARIASNQHLATHSPQKGLMRPYIAPDADCPTLHFGVRRDSGMSFSWRHGASRDA